MLVPAVQLLLASFGLFGLGQSGQLTLNNYTSIASNPLFTSAFRFSLLIALVTTALTIGIATAVSALLRTQVPGKRLITFLYKLPLVVPSLIAAFLVLTMIGPGGMLSRLLIPWGIVWPDLLHNRWGTGIVIVLLWHSLPVSILIVSAVTASIPQDVYEAAKTLGASPWFFSGGSRFRSARRASLRPRSWSSSIASEATLCLPSSGPPSRAPSP